MHDVVIATKYQILLAESFHYTATENIEGVHCCELLLMVCASFVQARARVRIICICWHINSTKAPQVARRLITAEIRGGSGPGRGAGCGARGRRR